MGRAHVGAFKSWPTAAFARLTYPRQTSSAILKPRQLCQTYETKLKVPVAPAQLETYPLLWVSVSPRAQSNPLKRSPSSMVGPHHSLSRGGERLL